jgi:ABC-2 type transport system permease protein
VDKTLWRSFKTAAWLGWQIESNWTRPLLFALYSIVKPLALAGILVVLYAVVTGSNFSSPVFAYMYLGNAFYTYVGAVMTGMSHAIAEDRERYETLRSIYVAPVDVRWYLAGRGVAGFIAGSASVIITLALGVVFLHVPIRFWTINWPLLFITLAVGMAMLAMMGLTLSGIVLLLPDNPWLGDGVAAAMYLFSGAVFPVNVLPRMVRPIGYATPVTYWLELVRRSLLGSVPGAIAFSRFSDSALLGVLLSLTVLLGVLALAAFRACDTVAREYGYIDRTTGH